MFSIIRYVLLCVSLPFSAAVDGRAVFSGLGGILKPGSRAFVNFTASGVRQVGVMIQIRSCGVGEFESERRCLSCPQGNLTSAYILFIVISSLSLFWVVI